MGDKQAFEKLKGKLETDFGDKVLVSGGPGRTAAFEVRANGKLIHSNIIENSGLVGSSAEYRAFLTKLKPILGV